MKMTELSWSNRVLYGLAAGLIAGIINSLWLAIFGQFGLFAFTNSTMVGIAIGSAVLGLVYGLFVLPSDYTSSAWKGLILGIASWVAFAIIYPALSAALPGVFGGFQSLATLGLASLVAFVVFGVLTGLIYSAISSYVGRTAFRPTERPMGQMGGERKDRERRM